jgi:glycolate oxidase FAD binding subunit
VLRLRYGALRDLVIGVTLALADGTLAASGGKVVKNVAGYDLPKLATGALGTLGVITQATFRLHPRPPQSRTLIMRVDRVGDLQALVHEVLDSQLVPSALQVRFGSDTEWNVDVLFEGTEAGVATQEAGLRDLVSSAHIGPGPDAVWTARQDLWQSPAQDPAAGSAIAKFTILPSDLGKTIEELTRATRERQVAWKLVVQATGIGWLRLDGVPGVLPAILKELRSTVERQGGSLVVVRHPPDAEPLDTWGNPGDTLSLMRALKQQLDPRATLNPDRFVGGI